MKKRFTKNRDHEKSIQQMLDDAKKKNIKSIWVNKKAKDITNYAKNSVHRCHSRNFLEQEKMTYR